MGDLKFILGFFAGWVATTDNGKKFANQLADGAMKLAKEFAEKSKSEAEPEKKG